MALNLASIMNGYLQGKEHMAAYQRQLLCVLACLVSNRLSS